MSIGKYFELTGYETLRPTNTVEEDLEKSYKKVDKASHIVSHTRSDPDDVKSSWRDGTKSPSTFH